MRKERGDGRDKTRLDSNKKVVIGEKRVVSNYMRKRKDRE